MIQAIIENTEQDRTEMIEERSKKFPKGNKSHEFDTENRQVLIMPNLSSSYSLSENGDVKHVELKPGKIILKPFLHSFIEHLDSTYDADQIEKS